MDLKKEDVVIGGRTFRLQKIPSIAASMLLNRLIRMAGPAVARAVSGASLSGLSGLLKADVGNFAPAIAEFFSQFTEAEQERLMRDLFAHIRFRNEKGEWVELLSIIDDVFTGRVFEMLQLEVAAIKFQFGDFSDALRAAISAAGKPAASEAPASV